MKFCPKCRNTVEDNIEHCPACKTHMPIIENRKLQEIDDIYKHNNYEVPEVDAEEIKNENSNLQSEKQVVSIGAWAMRMVIPIIPFIGPIIYLIMLFIWINDSSKEKSVSNWAWAQLIVMGIIIVVSVILGIIFIPKLASNQLQLIL